MVFGPLCYSSSFVESRLGTAAGQHVTGTCESRGSKGHVNGEREPDSDHTYVLCTRPDIDYCQVASSEDTYTVTKCHLSPDFQIPCRHASSVHWHPSTFLIAVMDPPVKPIGNIIPP